MWVSTREKISERKKLVICLLCGANPLFANDNPSWAEQYLDGGNALLCTLISHLNLHSNTYHVA